MQNELIDRFGKLPPEVEALFKVVALRNKCRELNIEKIETGDKGVLIGFYKDTFANPDGLLHYILAHPGVMSLRADQKVLWHRRWPDGVSRLQAIERLLEEFKDLAAKKVA
jgi:transcription-repair coupling factor (superfamily II helicase)